MKTLQLIQGSPEWKAVRLSKFTASEAPIMMGASKNMSRDDLLTYKTTQIEEEVSRFTQLIFDKGHALEAKARPIAESRLGEELYPVTGERDVDGLPLLASFDGLDMLEQIGFEHKQWNAEKAQSIAKTLQLQPEHYWQLEQQLLVAEADRILFVMSDGTEDNWIELEYQSIPERREQLIAGWKQFREDLKGYVPVVHASAPEPTPAKALPQVVYKLNGTALSSNIDIFKQKVGELVEANSGELKTDQDFADAEALIKQCKAAEDKLALVMEQVLGEIQDVNQFSNSLTEAKGMLSKLRLDRDKLVKKRKTEIRQEIITDRNRQLSAHIAQINQDLDGVALPVVNADFASAIKGKRTIKSLEEAANDELARAKIEANRAAVRVRDNLKMLNELANQYVFLFPDLQQIIDKETVDFIPLVKMRVSEHEQEEAQKEQEQAPEEQAAAPVPNPSTESSDYEFAPVDEGVTEIIYDPADLPIDDRDDVTETINLLDELFDWQDQFDIPEEAYLALLDILGISAVSDAAA